MAVAFKITGILMHGYVDNTVKYWEYLVLRLKALLKFQILVPEGMC